MIKKYFLFGLSILAVALLPLSSVAFAINYGGIGGSPAYPAPTNPRTKSIFIYQLQPGQQKTDGVKVLNNTNQVQTIALDAVDSEVASGGALSCKQAAEPKTDVGSWISLQSNQITLGPNSSQIVPFTLSVPKNKTLSVGEHDGCITIQAASQTATKSSQSGILLSFRSAIRVVVTIPGEITKKESIEQVHVSSKPDGSYQVSPVIKNEGDVSLDTNVKVGLVPIIGAAMHTVNEGSAPVLPHTTASWNYTLPAPYWGGFYQALVTVTYNTDPSTELGMSQSGYTATKQLRSTLFFTPPSLLPGLIELLVLAALIGGALCLVRRRFHYHHVHHHWQQYMVQAGDTIESLAEERGVSWKKVVLANRLKPPYTLKTGQTLKVPSHPKR